MKKFSTLFLAFAFVTAFVMFDSSAHGQITVASDGDVGIGTASPNSKLHVYNNSATSSRNIYSWNISTSNSSKYGIYSYVNPTGTGARYGIYTSTYGNTGSTSSTYGKYNYLSSYGNFGAANYNYLYTNGGSSTKYGLYTRIYCGSSDGTGARYALYASSGCSGGYAGYFQGDVYVAGTITSTSDASKKTNIEKLEGGLDIITQLKPKTYDYKTAENPQLPTEKQYGFIAQELAQVMPDLVKEVSTFNEFDEVDEEGNVREPEVSGSIQTVNYMALIPVLVEAVQEQQATIEAQQEQIRQLQEQVNQR